MGSSDTVRIMEFVRPVENGVDTLNSLVRLHGFDIKDDLRRGIIIPGSDDPSVAAENLFAGRPRFKQYSRIQLPFLRYIGKQTTNGFRPNLYNLADLLDTPPRKPRSVLARSLGSIPDELRHIALAFDNPDEKSAKAICGRLSIEPAKQKKGFELLLGIQNPEQFRQEGDVFNIKFATRSNIKSQTHLSPERQFAIPLAWFDISVTQAERAEYLEKIQPDVMSGRTVELGAISWYVKSTTDQA